jgi:1,4-dihydroxy-6-naphthoate synthase
MKLTLGFSPCPNDTYIFDALVNKKIDTGDLEFEVLMEDVETLNEWALEGRLDVTKLSFPAFFKSADNYLLLNAGAAIGNGVGPLLVANSAVPTEQVNSSVIALPGENTTAHMLFNYAYPDANNKVFMRFDTIEEFVLNNLDAVGVIIHESRFTYQEKGLHKLMDLGEYWESKSNAPIPLGAIAVNQSVKRSTALKVDRLIRTSVEYAVSKYPLLPDYVKEHSQTMSEEVMRQHINLYVNDYSIDMGEHGKMAVLKLYDVFQELFGEVLEKDLFLE